MKVQSDKEKNGGERGGGGDKEEEKNPCRTNKHKHAVGR